MSAPVEPVQERVCRECGCTDEDCSGCVERILLITGVVTGIDPLILLGNAWHAVAGVIRTLWSGLIGLFR